MEIPFGIYGVMLLLALFILHYRKEKTNHDKNVKSIPIRIWVNGTRGKSSVTRLIAAGLRAGSKKVIAKTTGTSPRFIIDSKIEQSVLRLGMPNIREQIRIFKRTTQYKPDAIVLECMALRPDLQEIESVQIVQPTLVVVTNVRADHLDVMGPTIKDAARTFIKALPKKCHLFLAENRLFDDFSKVLQQKNIKATISKTRDISDSVMKKFSYMEHKENVILALDVCKYFDVDEKIALKGMYNSKPDPGALRTYHLKLNDKKITFINAMAANDPDSTHQIWQTIDKNYDEINVLINCRSDRIDRTIQFAKIVKEHLHADHYILTGSGTKVLDRNLRRSVQKNNILNLGDKSPDQVIDSVAAFVSNKSLVFAIGNTAGYGVILMNLLLKHRRPDVI